MDDDRFLGILTIIVGVLVTLVLIGAIIVVAHFIAKVW